MGLPRRIEGYAIVSREGMIANADGTFPAHLKFEADQRFYLGSLAHADAIANGRHSAEGDPRAAERPRLVLTRRVPALAPDPENPKAVLWNPAGASLADAFAALKVEGTLAVIGGTEVFGLFRHIGYDAFFLSRGPVSVPNGRPVFPGVPAKSPEVLLAESGLHLAGERPLDPQAGVTLEQWTRG